MATTRQIRSRIRVAKNIQQITKAMKMVAAARLKRAQERVQSARPYAETMREVFALFPRLEERRNQAAGTMSGGEQQMLAIGRCLMGKPELIMFDEPSLGLAPTIVETTFAIIADIRRQGTTVLMVEQNAYLALRMADRAYVLETGRIVLAGAAADLMADDHVRRAYLGG